MSDDFDGVYACFMTPAERQMILNALGIYMGILRSENNEPAAQKVSDLWLAMNEMDFEEGVIE